MILSAYNFFIEFLVSLRKAVSAIVEYRGTLAGSVIEEVWVYILTSLNRYLHP